MENRKRRKRLPNEKIKKKLLTPFFVIFLIIISLLVVIINIFRHDYFKISQIYVDGNKMLSDEQILSKLNNPIGVNILVYDENKSLESLKKEEFIKEVNIKKEYPDKIIVNIKEEYPLMVVEYDNTNYIIANTSKVLDKTKNVNSLIKIKGLKKKPKIGENFTDKQTLLKFIEKLQTYKYSSNIKEIDLENYDHIGIILNDIHINFGNLKNYDYKLKLLDSVLKDINDKALTAYTISLDKGKDPVVEVEQKSQDQEDYEN